jgi:hypothetical protein
MFAFWQRMDVTEDRVLQKKTVVLARCDVGRSPWFMLKPEAGADQVARAAM